MSPLGLNNPLHPPEILGQRLMLKVQSPLVQTSQLILPQTVEKSDQFFSFPDNSSRSEPSQTPISTINRFVADDSEFDSTSEAKINPNTSAISEEPQIQPSIGENIQNNPLSELHPRLGKQLIQTQSRILTTASDKRLSPQTSEPSESQSIKNQSDNLPVIQAEWESDISQLISDESPQSSSPTVESQSLKSVGESSTVQSPQSESPSVEPQSLIQQQP
ncbi:MAG: hypothetical protein AAFO04_27870, partial [Cyanobacteria bacterium J06592_8]